MDMARLAAGMVFKRIITAMQNYADCDLICPNVDDGTIQDNLGYRITETI